MVQLSKRLDMNSLFSKAALSLCVYCCVLFHGEVVADVAFSESEISAIRAQGPWPTVFRQDPGNELSGKVWAEQIGKSLFNDASLSNSGGVSCASCHQAEQGFSDGVPVAVGEKTAFRNTQGLLNVGLQRWFGWDGGADSLWAASLRPLLAKHEMGANITDLASKLRMNSRYMAAFTINAKDVTADKEADLSNNTQLVVLAAKSLGAYVRTLRSGTTSFDKFRKALINGDKRGIDAYPSSAKRGLKLFIGKGNCRVCHFGANFSNGEFHDIGLSFFTDVGQVDSGRYSGISRVRQDPFSLVGAYGVGVSENERFITTGVKQSQLNWGQWRTPSMRNLKLTAPYMHNGSLNSLRAVVNWYSDIDSERLHTSGESLLKPLRFSEQEKKDLVEFLESLSIED